MKRGILILAFAICALPAFNTATAQANKTDTPSIEAVQAYLEISDNLATGGQIKPEEIPALKQAGFDVVISLAEANEEKNATEAFKVVEEGLTYVQIPVSRTEPSLRDLELFFDIMDNNKDRKVFVHCFTNKRASTFVYLYRTLRGGVSAEEAKTDLNKIWDPATKEQWKQFIEKATEKHAGS